MPSRMPPFSVLVYVFRAIGMAMHVCFCRIRSCFTGGLVKIMMLFHLMGFAGGVIVHAVLMMMPGFFFAHRDGFDRHAMNINHLASQPGTKEHRTDADQCHHDV